MTMCLQFQSRCRKKLPLSAEWKMQFRRGVWKLPLSAEWKIEKNLEVVFNAL